MKLKKKTINYSNIFPNHCRNNSNNCVKEIIKTNPKYNEYTSVGSLKKNFEELKIVINQKFYPTKIIGTNISYLFYATKYADIIDTLLIKDPTFTIG